MREVDPQPIQSAPLEQNDSFIQEAQKDPGEEFSSTRVGVSSKMAKRSRPSRVWLVGGTLFLVLAVIFAGVLSFCSQTSSRQVSLQKPTVVQPSRHNASLPKPMVIPTPKGTPINSPVLSDHNLAMTIMDGVAYVGTVDNALYALRSSNGTMLWRYKINGVVNEAPLVVDGVVYVSAYAGQSGPDTVYALRASDGTPLWHYTSNDDSYIDTPTVENGIAYFTSKNAIMGFRANDGTLLWHYPAHGYISLLPQVVNGAIYAQANGDGGPGTIYALQASDGTPLWHYTANTSLSLQEVLDGVVYADAQDGTLVAMRAGDGHVLWRRTLDGNIYQFVPVNGVIYATSVKISMPTAATRGTSSLLQALPLGALLWSNIQNIPAKPTAPLKEGHSTVYALRINDGAILWRFSMPNEENSWASSCAVENGVVYVSMHVFTSGNTDKSYLYALQGGTGSVLWQDELNAGPSNALLANGVIYFSSNNGSYIGAIYAIRAQDGSLLWSYPIEGVVFEAPVFLNGVVYVSAANGMVYALRADNGSVIWHYLTDING